MYFLFCRGTKFRVVGHLCSGYMPPPHMHMSYYKSNVDLCQSFGVVVFVELNFLEDESHKKRRTKCVRTRT